MNNITKTAMITICGRPNVGKSSLTNALVGEKIAIVSDKPQTTRNRIYGVVNRGDTQYVLLDTPGLHKPRSRLGDYMVKVVRESLEQVEAALLLVEPIAHVGEPEKILLQRIQEEHLPCVLCINKIDTVEKKDDLLAVIAAYSQAFDGFDAIIPISARTGEGVDRLLEMIDRRLDKGTRRVTIHLPYDKGGLLDMLYREAKVESVEYSETIDIVAVCPPKVLGQIGDYTPDWTPPKEDWE